jgi:DNA invertase Pin-like site-specific DNA recombinase
MKIALYARVSTRDKGQDTENQLTELRTFAARNSWTIVREYVDHESGGRADRIQFQQMFTDAAQRRFDLLLFWSLDRFSREGVLETLQHLNRLTAAGVGYRSFTEQYFDSCGIFKDAVISILATIARQEKIRIRERVMAGLARARARGRKLGRPKTYVNARRVAELRAQGKSWRQIARQMACSSKTCMRALESRSKTPQGDFVRAEDGDVDTKAEDGAAATT